METEDAAEKKAAAKAEDLLEKKEVAYYTEALRTWYLTSMEHDRSLLTLSAGGIGLLVTLLTKFNSPPFTVRLFYVVAIVFFGLCIGVVLAIFKRNRKHLEGVIHSLESEDQLLQRLDYIAVISFLVGIVFSSLIGVYAALFTEPADETKLPASNITTTTTTITAEKQMAQDKQKQVSEQARSDNVSGASGMAPARTLKQIRESVEGAAKLRPAAPQGAQNQASKQSAEKRLV